MARARNIKPGIMDNEVLAECDFSARLLFVYLWMLADRDGRLEDRPKRIRVQAFPYDEGVDADTLLQQLHEKQFIQRYEVDGNQYIQILKFSEHQTPHVKEKASTIPAPDRVGARPVQAPDKVGAVTGQGSAEHETSTNPAPPDSLIPDSLIPDSGGAKKPAPAARGTRLPADWKIPEDWKTEAKKIRPEWHDQHIERVSEIFRDYWIGKTGKDGTKADWLATWRNWCRRDTTQMYPGPQSAIGPASHGGKPANGQPYDPRQDPNWRPKPMPRPGQRAQTPQGHDA